MIEEISLFMETFTATQSFNKRKLSIAGVSIYYSTQAYFYEGLKSSGAKPV